MKLTQKIINKIIAPVTERLLSATYGVYSSKVSEPIDFDTWCLDVKNVLNYDTSLDNSSSIESTDC